MLFLELRNTFHEGEAFFRQAVDELRSYLASGSSDQASVEILLGEMLSPLGWFCFRLGCVDEAFDLIREATGLLRTYNQPASLAINLWHYANVCWFAGHFDEAMQAIEEALEIQLNLDQSWGVANMTIYQGVIALELGDYDRAYDRLMQGLSLARDCGDPRLISFAVIYLDRTPQARSRYSEMKPLFEEIMEYAIQTGNRYGKGVVLERMALAEQAAGNTARARQLLGESIQLFEEIEDLWSYSRVLTYLGHMALADGDQEQALSVYAQAFRTAVNTHLYPNALDALAGLAAVKAGKEEFESALDLTFQILQHPAGTQAARQRAEQLKVEIEADKVFQSRNLPPGLFRLKSLDEILQEFTLLFPSIDKTNS
jgi:tetratricopeptide (TPR) repeat protein